MPKLNSAERRGARWSPPPPSPPAPSQKSFLVNCASPLSTGCGSSRPPPSGLTTILLLHSFFPVLCFAAAAAVSHARGSPCARPADSKTELSHSHHRSSHSRILDGRTDGRTCLVSLLAVSGLASHPTLRGSAHPTHPLLSRIYLYHTSGLARGLDTIVEACGTAGGLDLSVRRQRNLAAGTRGRGWQALQEPLEMMVERAWGLGQLSACLAVGGARTQSCLPKISRETSRRKMPRVCHRRSSRSTPFHSSPSLQRVQRSKGPNDARECRYLGGIVNC